MEAVVDDALRDFRAVYRAHYGLVWHALFRLGVPPDALEDAVQDVFVVAYRRRDDYAGTSTRRGCTGLPGAWRATSGGPGGDGRSAFVPSRTPGPARPATPATTS